MRKKKNFKMADIKTQNPGYEKCYLYGRQHMAYANDQRIKVMKTDDP